MTDATTPPRARDIRPMTGGYFQAMTDILGLSIRDIRELFGEGDDNPISEPTVRAWRRGRATMPDAVADELARMLDDTDAAVEELVDVLLDMDNPVITVYSGGATFREKHPDDDDMPPRWWMHVAARAAERVPAARIEMHDEWEVKRGWRAS